MWSTDKDGIILGLLAAEIAAVTGRNPGQHYQRLTKIHVTPCYRRIDSPIDDAQRVAFKQLTPDKVLAKILAGEEIVRILTKASGNDAAIGGIKVETTNGSLAAPPSGAEAVFKLYVESLFSDVHLRTILEEAVEVLGMP